MFKKAAPTATSIAIRRLLRCNRLCRRLRGCPIRRRLGCRLRSNLCGDLRLLPFLLCARRSFGTLALSFFLLRDGIAGACQYLILLSRR